MYFSGAASKVWDVLFVEAKLVQNLADKMPDILYTNTESIHDWMAILSLM